MPEDAVGVERVTAIVTPVAAVEVAPVTETPAVATDAAAATQTAVPAPSLSLES